MGGSAGFQYEVRYWPGRANGNTDALSRKMRDFRTLESLKQIVVPDSIRKQVMEWVHDRAGDLGAEKVLGLARRHFF
ncbi:hypothetical protein SKAU_G00348730 [Synaphobranchus kaupii]|uniref:Uncharacterized protein n=1 Tax=Synaphobranchus kaupii TaxID=118154 RepID=A0A9Q1EK79_SYNKA|nr:hypothetical protein SKAU_G00348730 [Synaphobranchus kaupii]